MSEAAPPGASDEIASAAEPVFIYSAFDGPGPARYHGEALVSARSLRRHTDRPVHLVSNRPDIAERFAARPDNPFSAIEPPADGESIAKLAKIRAIARHGDRNCVFLDTDTFVLDDIARVFEFAPFDMAAVRMPYHHEEIVSIDDAVKYEHQYQYHLNSGVLFLRAGFAARLAREWERTFLDFVERDGPGTMDQPPLTKALLGMRPDLFALSQNYNYRSIYGGLVSGGIFVVHTHYERDLDALLAADFPSAMMDALIDRVALVNEDAGRALLPRVPAGTLPAALLRRSNARRKRQRGSGLRLPFGLRSGSVR